MNPINLKSVVFLVKTKFDSKQCPCEGLDEIVHLLHMLYICCLFACIENKCKSFFCGCFPFLTVPFLWRDLVGWFQLLTEIDVGADVMAKVI